MLKHLKNRINKPFIKFFNFFKKTSKVSDYTDDIYYEQQNSGSQQTLKQKQIGTFGFVLVTVSKEEGPS